MGYTRYKTLIMNYLQIFFTNKWHKGHHRITPNSGRALKSALCLLSVQSGDCLRNGLSTRPFFVRRNPELPLPLTTNNRPRRYTGISGGCVGREAGRKQKTQSSKTTFHHIEYTENKKPPQRRLYENNLEKILFFLTIYLYLCNKQSGSLKWQNKVEYRSSLVSLSLPTFIGKQFNLLIIWRL